MCAADAAHIEVGRRIRAWLIQAYPHDGAKLAARDFDASPHTTRRWFEGAMPENKHFAAMVRRWGKRFVAFVMEPLVGPWATYTMDLDLDDMRRRLAVLDAELKGERDAFDGLQTDAAVSPVAGGEEPSRRRTLEDAPPPDCRKKPRA